MDIVRSLPEKAMALAAHGATVASVVGEMEYGPVFLVFLAVGGLVVMNFIFGTLEEVFNRLIRPGKNLKRYGKWAVVTGATDGIGQAMAMELARKGMNIFLMSRTKSKLEATRDAILAKHGVEVKFMAVDFSLFGKDDGEELMTSVRDALKDMEIGVLINNVGMSYDFCKYFHELTDAQVTDLISLNVQSTTWMTRYVLPGMNARKGGYIVNMASAAGVTTAPLLAQYGGVKSYIAMFSRALNAENQYVHVQCQVPLFVSTKLAKIRHASLTVPTPANYAKYAVAAIGYETVVSPYITHSPYLWLISALPEWLSVAITGAMHKGIRAAGMKKQARLAKENKSS